MSCCEKIKNLPLQDFCETINFGANSNKSGEFQFIKSNSNQLIATKTFGNNVPLVIENVFSENMVITFKIIDPDGLTFTDPLDHDCFRINILPYKTVEL